MRAGENKILGPSADSKKLANWGGRRGDASVVTCCRTPPALSTCPLVVSVFWQERGSGRRTPSPTDGSRQVRVWGRGGFGACSLVLGFPWVFGFWVPLGNLGFPVLFTK